MKKIILKNLAFISLLILASCEKGPQGKPGKDGNANVKNIEVTIDSADWTYSNYGAFSAYQLPDITSDLINHGAVSCYLKIDSVVWTVLPYSAIDVINGNELIYSFSISDGQIIFYAYYAGFIPMTTMWDRTYKIVMISG